MGDEPKEEKVEYPLNFSCPQCGSTRRVCKEGMLGRRHLPHLEAMIKSGKSIGFGMFSVASPGLAYDTVIVALLDVCLDCGNVYAFEVTGQKVPKQGLPGGHPPPFMGGPFDKS